MSTSLRLFALFTSITMLTSLTGCGTTKPAASAVAPQMSRSEAMDIVKKEAALGYSLRGKMGIAYAYVTEVTESGLAITTDKRYEIYPGLAVIAVDALIAGKQPPYVTLGPVPFDDVYEIAKMRGGGWINIYARQQSKKFMMTTQATKNIDQLLAALHVLCPNAK